MDDLYRQNILDHHQSPRCYGPLDSADVVVEETNASCGDKVRLFIKLNPEKNKVVGVSFEGMGCAISTAATSMFLEKISQEQMLVTDLLSLTSEQLMSKLELSVSPARLKCLTLSLVALKKALANLEQ